MHHKSWAIITEESNKSMKQNDEFELSNAPKSGKQSG
jgi:hypothetical protein